MRTRQSCNLVNDGVQNSGGLARLTVADNQFALTASDGNQRIDGFQSRLQRFVNAFAGNDAGGFDIDGAEFVGFDFAFAVNGIAQSVNHASQQSFANGRADDVARAFDGFAFVDFGVGAEHNNADAVGFKVQRHSFDAACEFDHFARLHFVQTVNARNAVADGQNLSDLRRIGRGVKVFNAFFQ